LLESWVPVNCTIAIGITDVPLEPEVPELPEVPPEITTVTFPFPSLITAAPLNVNPLTFGTDVVPSPTVSGDAPPPDVNPVT
jgi:hypothetical protein